MTITDQFISDIAKHEMLAMRDDGVNRHLRFKRPGTMCMHFDILTWPGYLCYTGDMGTFVFRRTTDMLEFFRAGRNDKPYRIDFRYWAEKVEAADKGDGLEAFSAEKFKSEVRDYFEQATADANDWTAERKAALWSEIESDVIGRVEDDGEGVAWAALRDFNHDGFRFEDWERSCKEYSHRFLWCCHALEWAVRTYDASKADATAALEAAQAQQAAVEPVAFQFQVQPWLLECFGEMIAGDREERNHRFLEESLELVQACGCSQSEANQLVDYVFNRPIGDPPQEVGGVMVTLAALCLAQGMDMHKCGDTELARVWTKVEDIRAKQAAKPKHSPLPIDAPPDTTASMRAALDVAGKLRHALSNVLQHTPKEMWPKWLAVRDECDAEIRSLRGAVTQEQNFCESCAMDLSTCDCVDPRPVYVEASVETADPMDWPLPCDVTVGHGTMQKGVKLRTLVARMKSLYEMATGQNADEVSGRSMAARDVLAERLRQITAEGWQPIETAPKDGTYILLGSADGSWIARNYPVYQSGYRPDDPWQSMMLNHEHMGRYPKAKPTHWRPLPAAPGAQP